MKNTIAAIEPEEVKAWVYMGPNYMLQGDGFYISYNPGEYGGMPFFDADNSSDETAICKDGRYFILNGDFRREYEKVVDKGIDACMKIFKKNRALKSSWSNDL